MAIPILLLSLFLFLCVFVSVQTLSPEENSDKTKLDLNCASPQNSHHFLGEELGGLYRDRGLGRKVILFCTSRKSNIPRLRQLEQSEGNVGIWEEAGHKAGGGGPGEGLVWAAAPGLGQWRQAESHHRSPACLTFGRWILGMDAKYNVFFSSAVHASHLVK